MIFSSETPSHIFKPPCFELGKSAQLAVAFLICLILTHFWHVGGSWQISVGSVYGVSYVLLSVFPIFETIYVSKTN